MTTVNSFTDILRIIREQPEWADALRSALLGQDLLELPKRFDKFARTTDARLTNLEADVAELKSGQARLEADVAELKSGQARLEARQDRMETRQDRMEGIVGNIRGDTYELKVGNNIFSIVGQRLDIRPVRVLKGSRAPNDMAFLDLIYEASDLGVITERDRIEAFEVDVVLEGRRHPERSSLYVVLEISRTVADYDISRASERAEIVRRATGEQTLPVVVCAYADQQRQQLAQERNVTLVTYGE